LAALEAAPDPTDARLRLRAALRRIVEDVWLLVVPHGRGRDRLCAVQIYFAGRGRHRDYLILHRPATGGRVGVRPARWWTKSLSTVTAPGDLDLRKRADARKLEAVLSSLDVGALSDALDTPNG
jgi:hypothetical protein